MRKQTRRSISLKEKTYNTLRNWCNANHCSMSGFVESRIAEFFSDTPQNETESSWSALKKTRYPGSKKIKETPAPAQNKPVSGSGIHEL